jgi:hypothetical protein
MNSIRHVYFQRADLFAKVVDDHHGLAPLYERAARAITKQDPAAAAKATRALADAQTQRLGA